MRCLLALVGLLVHDGSHIWKLLIVFARLGISSEDLNSASKSQSVRATIDESSAEFTEHGIWSTRKTLYTQDLGRALMLGPRTRHYLRCRTLSPLPNGYLSSCSMWLAVRLAREPDDGILEARLQHSRCNTLASNPFWQDSTGTFAEEEAYSKMTSERSSSEAIIRIQENNTGSRDVEVCISPQITLSNWLKGDAKRHWTGSAAAERMPADLGESTRPLRKPPQRNCI